MLRHVSVPYGLRLALNEYILIIILFCHFYNKALFIVTRRKDIQGSLFACGCFEQSLEKIGN